MSRRNQVATFMDVAGVTATLHKFFNPKRLTVLAYHRITDPSAPDFRGFEPNVSATPELFEAQMAYVKARFNVISLADLVAWFQQKKPLPPAPLLITFDDGYLDNYENAFPILKKYAFPALIFLMTSGMETPTKWAWWDECAELFRQTRQTHANLPLLGKVETLDETTRNRFMEKLKTRPNAEKQAIVGQLPALLGVEPLSAQKPFFMNWEQVNELVANGVACQPHTVNHPILTRISVDEVRQELAESKAIIQHKTGQEITAFAYPNGQLSDYNTDIIQILKDLDYQLAVTLSTGPVPLSEVRRFEIARVFLSHKDSLAMFKLKTTALANWQSPVQYVGD